MQEKDTLTGEHKGNWLTGCLYRFLFLFVVIMSASIYKTLTKPYTIHRIIEQYRLNKTLSELSHSKDLTINIPRENIEETQEQETSETYIPQPKILKENVVINLNWIKYYPYPGYSMGICEIYGYVKNYTQRDLYYVEAVITFCDSKFKKEYDHFPLNIVLQPPLHPGEIRRFSRIIYNIQEKAFKHKSVYYKVEITTWY